MAKKKRGGAHGGHGWFVTFADLMALLLSFFVMLVAFSTQDQQKLKIVAGSMREAFGVQVDSRLSGIIETEGLATRSRLKHLQQNPDEAKNPTIPDQVERGKLDGARLKVDREFALASASLRQALQDLPELTEMSKHIMFEETKEGLNLEIVDQDGRSMFPEGNKEPYERTRKVVQKLAGQFKAMPYRMSIAGHTSASKVPAKRGYGPWELSADRANAIRQILEDEGVPVGHFFQVAGKADTQPLFPDDPYISSNRRVTITLMREAPPMPAGFKP
jgi:chemotaxis protein MotB